MYLVHLSDAFGETTYDTFCQNDLELVDLIRNIRSEYEFDGAEVIDCVYFNYKEFIKNVDIEHGSK